MGAGNDFGSRDGMDFLMKLEDICQNTYMIISKAF